MKTTLLTILTAISIGVFSQENSYKVDPQKSSITWKAEKVTGNHEGTVKVTNGTLIIKGGVLQAGKFEVDMTSIVVTDIKDPEYNQKLTGHLKSEDFFGVEKFPKAMLETSRVIHEGKDRYKIEGRLTIKGVTKNVKFTAFVVEENGTIKGTAVMVIDRSEYNVRYGSGTFFDDLGDKTIYDEFTLNVSLIANK